VLDHAITVPFAGHIVSVAVVSINCSGNLEGTLRALPCPLSWRCRPSTFPELLIYTAELSPKKLENGILMRLIRRFLSLSPDVLFLSW
jgi:hypothetical protein